jgi:uncharacterized protein (DUF2384 family)
MNGEPARIREASGRELGAAALRTFFRVAELWDLSAEESMTLLGITSPSTYYKWRKAPPRRISPDMLERISYVLGIYKSLQILLPNERQADTWVRRPNTNPLYGGRPRSSGCCPDRFADLYVVRRHLDAERGGWP